MTRLSPRRCCRTEKTPPRPGFEGKKLLLYGAYKVGKSTLAAQLDEPAVPRDRARPGRARGLPVPVRSWHDFRQVGAELASTEHPFDLLVVDTVDELARLCVETSSAGWRRAPASTQEVPPRLRLRLRQGLGRHRAGVPAARREAVQPRLGVVFISHEKESMHQDPHGLEITKLAPDVGQKGMRKWLLGFVDFVAARRGASRPPTGRAARPAPQADRDGGGRRPGARGRDEVPDTDPAVGGHLKATLDKALA
jgi:hypothetical protein